LKLGVVLPTSGWASLTKDLFEIERKFTHGGTGLSGTFDFPIKIIPQSGIFNFSASYIFGDAVAASYKNRRLSYEEDGGFKYEPNNWLYNDYFIRYTAQGHYTFGFSIDETYLLRIGVGATIYGAETWRDYLETNEFGEIDTLFKKADNGGETTVGGISLKMEFMSRDITTPFGASVQYFDESLYANAWLQIPIVSGSFFLRVEAKGFIAAFKDNLHPWENKGVFMPSARLIFNF
jgi:hypothetical protein